MRSHPSAVLIPCTRCEHPRASFWGEVHGGAQPAPPSIAGAEDLTDAEGHGGMGPWRSPHSPAAGTRLDPD